MEIAPLTPDQRLRVFVSSTLKELAPERVAAREALESLRLIPVMLEMGARPHPPRDLYRSYLSQSDIFLGIYWESYGWVPPGDLVSGLEDEYLLSGDKPKLIYVKKSENRDPKLDILLSRIQIDDRASYKPFADADELRGLIENDLALLLTEHFEMSQVDPQAVSAPAPHRAPLPAQPTVFVGRERELATVVDVLERDDVRLLTLSGPGGIGKSRLAFEAARRVEAHFPDGLVYALLSSLSDSSLVVPAIAQAVGVRESADRRILDALKEYLAPKGMLLILDNFERVIAAGPSISELLSACPDLSVVVTSRAALNVRGEHELQVPPLGVPAAEDARSASELARSDAVELFVDRARSANPTFELTDANAASVAEICERLDGLPLAIELAAARSRMLTPEMMLERLSNKLELLSRGPRDLPERQQTLRDLLDWDYELLDENEARAFRRLSVFIGGFTLSAVERILPVAGDDPMDVLDVLDSLVRKSLVRQLDPLRGDPRFGMLSTLREYAYEKLEAGGKASKIKDRHLAFFLELAEKASSHLRAADQVAWLEVLEREHDNMRAALRWAVESGDSIRELALAGNLAKFWEFHGHLTEGQRWLEGALSRATQAPIELRALCLDGAGILARSQGEFKRSVTWLEECLTLRRRLGDKAALANTSRQMGNTLADIGDFETSRVYYEEALDLFKQADNGAGVAAILNNLGVLATIDEDWDRAGSLYEESLDYFRSHEDLQGIARGLMNLGEVRMMQGDYETAKELLKESFVMFEKLESRWDIVYVLEGMANVAFGRERPADAAKLFGAAEYLREALGAAMPPSEQEPYQRHVASVRAALDEATFTAAWDAGRHLSIDEALRFALSM